MPVIEHPAPDTIRFERTLDAPVSTVWRYLVDPKLRGEWFAGGATDSFEGGQIELKFDHDNLSADDVPYPPAYAASKGRKSIERIIRYEPERALAFSWDGGKEGVATFELFAVGDKTRLVLTHTGITGTSGISGYGAGWNSHLAVLRAKLAGEEVRNFWALHERSGAEVAADLGLNVNAG